MNEVLTSTVESPIGPLTLVARDGALTNISMHEQCHVVTTTGRRHVRTTRVQGRRCALHAYFAGELSTFDLEMNLLGTPFQQVCGPVVRDPLRRNDFLRRTGPAGREPQGVACRWSG